MIFDKDIVEFSGVNGTGKCTVEWSNRTCGFILTTPSYGKEHTKMSGRGKLKIIGNLYDTNN